MPEVPLENAHETIEHHAVHSGERWIMGVALTAAICAALAAITALLAEHHAEEAMLNEIRSSDKWNEYQADSMKSKIIETKISLLEAMGKEAPKADTDKVKEYARDKQGIKDNAEKFKEEADSHLMRHVPLSRALTFFQVAIAIGAVSALTKKKAFWFVAIAVGVCGLFFFAVGLAPMKAGKLDGNNAAENKPAAVEVHH